MSARRPPRGKAKDDALAQELDIQTVNYGEPIPPNTWCHYCGFLAQSRDHIVPVSAHGADAWWNLVPSCHACNDGKADRQACSCMFCLRAIALWHLGYRREGRTYREKKHLRKEKRRMEAACPTSL